MKQEFKDIEPQIDKSSGDSKLLPEKEAHQECLMMRKALNLDKDGMLSKLNDSTSEWEKTRPTKEDFDEAHEKIDEIIKLAEEEPKTEKFLYALGRILNSTTMVSAKIITQILASSTRLLFPLGDEDRTKPAWDSIDKTHEDFKRLLVDKQKILDDYKENANKSALYQNQ